MPWTETPPFERGNSFVNGGLIDTVNDPQPGINFEGKEYIFPDKVYGSGVPVKVRCVRNTTGGLVFPGRLYQYDPAYPRQRINSASIVTSQKCFPLDELLPAAGVQNNDLVYVVISGPALVYTAATPGVSGANVIINPGDQLVAMTASTSGAPDAGAVFPGATVGSTAISNNLIGYAVSAATTANTNMGIVAMIESRW